MKEIKDKPTQFRLNETEREFLEFLGKGNLSHGLHEALVKCGINEFVKNKKNPILSEGDVLKFDHDKADFVIDNSGTPVGNENFIQMRDEESVFVSKIHNLKYEVKKIDNWNNIKITKVSEWKKNS